jgi:hypothetical protein
MDIQKILTLFHAHAWLALTTLAIGGLVRLSKSDAIGPVIPAKYRPVLAYVLGAAAAVVNALQGGVPLTVILYGFGAPALAIIGHVLGIELGRGGQEIPLPVFLRAGKPPSGPSSTGGAAVGLAVFAVVALTGCSAPGVLTPGAKTVLKGINEAAHVLCLLAHAKQAGISPEQVAATLCDTEEKIHPWIAPALGAQRAGAIRAGLDSDAGTP